MNRSLQRSLKQCLLLLGLSGSAATMATPPVSAEAAQEIQRVAGDHRLLLLGELHGTRETPSLVASVVARYAREGPVVLGLEFSRAGHAALRVYLDSDGSRQARQQLRSQPFLLAPGGRNDGRRSEDMLDLVEQVRLLRKSGQDVAILPYDVIASGNDSEARDRDMAEYLRVAYRALPRGRLIVFAGNVHAMRQRPYFPDAAKFQTPMGEHLAGLGPFSISVNVLAGQMSACFSECGPQDVFPRQDSSGPASGPFRHSYDYEIVLPKFTPARMIDKGRLP